MRKTALNQLLEYKDELIKNGELTTIGIFQEVINKANELLETEKQQIIEAVNETNKSCVILANNVIQKMNPGCRYLFEHDIDTGLNYYNSEFQK